MDTWQIILAIVIVALSIIMPIYYSSEKKKIEHQKELEKIKKYGEAINQFTKNKNNYSSFEKSSLQFLRIQRVNEKLNLQLLANAQFADKNLDSSEKLSLGGATGVRAYPSGEASGDEGRKISVDAKYNVKSGTKVGDIIFSVFYDYGKIRQYKDTLDISMTTPNEYSLEGWGMAVDLISAGKFNVKAGWADAIGGNPGKTSAGKNSDGRGDLSRYWFLASVQF